MNIKNIRQKFQKKWNFLFLTSYYLDMSTAFYSLQQGSLNSDDMLLYVTVRNNPKLEGELIHLEGQTWIVASGFKEHSSRDLFEYKLYPANDILHFKVVHKIKNDVGIVELKETSEIVKVPCYVDDYSLKERTSPTKQVNEAFQKSFFIAANSLDIINKVYILFYRDQAYKLESLERSIGLIKVRATENL